MSDEWTAKLDTYLDGELPADQMQALDAHVRSCPSCAADVLNRVQIKKALQSAGKRYQASDDFRLRLQKTITPRSRVSARWVSLATAAALVVLLIGGLGYNRYTSIRLERQHVLSELVDLHVATIASSTPVDVVSSDRHTVKPWFQGKIPFTFNLPELQGPDFTLVGGRVTYLGQTPGAHLIYQYRKHQISVFIIPDRDGDRSEFTRPGPEKQMSFEVETWSQGGLRYFIVGDASPQEIGQLADLLKAAAKQ